MTGLTGRLGSTGPQGSKGPIGITGSQGETGPQGPTGQHGDTYFTLNFTGFCGTTLMLVLTSDFPLEVPSIYVDSGNINSCQNISLNVAGSNVMTLSTAGFVGIGTTNPQNLLDVSSNGQAILEVYNTTNGTGIGVNNFVNFGSTNYAPSGYGISQTSGVMYFNNQGGPQAPLDGYYQEIITGPAILAPYGISYLNSFNGPYNVTLMNSNVGAIKILSLYEDNGSQVTINTSQGSCYVAPGLFNRTLVMSPDSTWKILSEKNISFFPTTQQGPKLVGQGYTGTNTEEGNSVSLSADGNTLAVGGINDNGSIGATWIFIRSDVMWVQQAKLVGTGVTGIQGSRQGYSVSLSADGNTLAVGGSFDGNFVGATWIFTRSGGVWTQQAKLVGTGYNTTGTPGQGSSVSISADGNTLAVGGHGDNNGIGATWIFTRSGGVWTQQGSKLVGQGYTGGPEQGFSVSISADGNTLAVGGINDNNGIGATWIFQFSNGSWNQQGNKLVGSGYIIAGAGLVYQGYSVSLSADGNTLAVGGPQDNNIIGATWIFVSVNGNWIQQVKIVPSGYTAISSIGNSVSLSADGNTLVMGGASDDSVVGAVWTFTRIDTVWTQQNKLIGSGYTGNPGEGFSVSLSANASTLAVGGTGDNFNTGAVWVFV
jgi:hypothetical protein